MPSPIQLPPCSNPKVPQPQAPFYHRIELQIRFNDIDILGHVNNSVYLSFMDLGKARYFTDVTDQRVELGGLSVAIVNISCDFFSPAYFGEALELVTRVTSVSVHSFKMEQRIYNPVTGDVKCISRSVLAGFDPKQAKGLELPLPLVEQLESFEGRTLRKPI